MSTIKANYQLKGDQLEDLIVKRALKYEEAGIATVKRYGVQATKRLLRDERGQVKRDERGVVQYHWQVLKSKPDFEGVVQGARQFVFDCKVISGSSFSLADYRNETKGPYRRQLNFMFERSKFGVRCFFLMHWNARELATKSDPAMTIAFPVHPSMQFWKEFLAGEKKSISRMECVELGRVIPWTLFGPRDQSMQPDFLAAL